MTIREYDLALKEYDRLIEFYQDINTDKAIGMIHWLEQKKDDLIESQIPL